MRHGMWLAMVVGCSSASHSNDDVDAPGLDAVDAVMATHDAPTHVVTVMTMNLRTALPSDATVDQRTALVAQLIETEHPDVVALQEITESLTMMNRGQALADATGYAWTWKLTHQLIVGNEGIGILTRG